MIKNKIVIYGAGRQGIALSRCVGSGCVVGFIDDSEFLKGRRLVGHRILGRESDIPTIHAVHKFNEIWVTFEMQPEQRERVESLCKKQGIELIFIPEHEPFVRVVYQKTDKDPGRLYPQPAVQEGLRAYHQEAV